jgi:hypothetical protein
MNVVQAAGASVLYVLLLGIVYVLHARYFPVDVVLYSALLDVAIAAALSLLLLTLLGALSRLSGLERTLLVGVWLLGGYAAALSGPTVLDRSLSFYLLEKLQQRGGGIELTRMQDVFIHEYLPEHRLIDIRITEQLASGTLIIDQGCVRLTPRGDRLALASRWFRTEILPRHRLLMGEYTDILTDPFRDGRHPDGVDYRC